MADRLSVARDFLNKEDNNLYKYHGGMPIGFLAAIAEHESGGRMNSAGDPSLGEVGYFQVPTETAQVLGVDPDIRYNNEGNIFLACLEYQVYAARIYKRFPMMSLGSADNWMYARLVFAIGIGATQNFLNHANADGVSYGIYSNFVAWANNGNVDGKQLARINDIVVQWNIGSNLAYSSPDLPQKIPAYVPYTIPNDVQGLLSSGVSSTLKYLVAAALLAGLIYEVA